MRRKVLAGIKVFFQFLWRFAAGLGLLAFAIILPGSELRQWNQFRASNSWTGVMGTITQSGPPLYSEGDYDPMIYYEFEDRGKRCIGNGVQFGVIGPRALSYSDAKSWNAKYPVGSRVTVYYAPNSFPCMDNVLERVYKPNWYLPVWCLLSLIAAVAGLGLMGYAIGLATKYIRGLSHIG